MAKDRERPDDEKRSEKKKRPKAPPPEVKERKTARQFTAKFGRKPVSYTATAGTQVFEVGDDKVSFFYMSYTQDDMDPATRPVLFCFNGGPGSSTVWLNLGLFGPKRMVFDDNGFKIGMQGKLVDNEHSILDVSDVVCIDAIGTGLSRTAEKGEEKKFHHFKKDIEAFSQFIVHYLNRNGRWASPKYLAGESYGTLRGAGIARELFVTHDVELNGIIFISMILNYQTSAIDRTNMLVHAGNDLPFAVYLPTYAATAWYHGRLPKKYQSKSLRDLLDEVEEFALGEYWAALAQGDQLDDKRKAAVAQKLGNYTGLAPEFIDLYNLRIHIMRFCKELLREKRRTVGRIDSRFLGIDRDTAGNNLETDPSTDAFSGVAASALNHYLREEIGFESDDVYNIMSMDVWQNWDYEDFKGRYVDTSESFRELLSRSRGTKVLIANGYYDLATPHFATEYTVSHMGLDPEVRPNVRLTYYEAGHMMYVHKPSLEKLASDLREFVNDTS
ncbi:MAG TPA: peptidase S10 [Acidimicrobiia bacterium]|nr:peptidase S10 [Acidimicrobiia bacterium]